MQSIDDIRLKNLELLVQRFGTQRALADRAGIKNPAQISQWINRTVDKKTGKPRAMKSSTARTIERNIGLVPNWMDTEHGDNANGNYVGGDAAPTHYRLSEPTTGDQSMSIELRSVRGSCGGGAMDFDDDERQPLIKEASWFRKYNVTPANALAVWADGDSMADFIVHGDIVIFNKTKTEPRSGAIFLVQHPDGLRIKRLRRTVDGAWILESDNQDKLRYPSERIAPDELELLKILGEFVYRQGG